MVDDQRSGRVAELTIALSLATDLGTGQPMEHGMRTCALALAASEALSLDPATRSCVFYTAQLRFLGCTSDAAETATLAGGDDIGFNSVMAPALNGQPLESAVHFVRHLAQELPMALRLGRVARAVLDPGAGARSLAGHCEVASRLAERLGMDASVRDALAHAYERWDGKGLPSGLEGESVPVAVRVVTVARDVELWARLGDWSLVVEVLSRRRGHSYDPAVVDAFIGDGREWLEGIPSDPCAAVLAAEPSPVRTLGADELDGSLQAVADFVDVTSPYFRTHSTGVAALVGAAGRLAGLSAADATALRRAALVHDVGRVGVPNGIWDHRGPLSAGQWERVRMHPYLTERVLRRCTLLEPYATLAAHHHERVDGSGYHRGSSGDQLGLGARLLAAADAFHAMTEERPHRPARGPAEAASILGDEVDAGRFTHPEVDAVVAAAGEVARAPRVDRPGRLTEREVDVLRLIARGHTNRQAAAILGISPKTVGHHVEHVYAKAGVSTRAGATLFAMENDLLGP